MMVTGEYKIKRQRTATNIHTRTTTAQKSKTMKCTEPCIRQEELEKQISDLLQPFSLSEQWTTSLLSMIEKDVKENSQSSVAFVQETAEKLQALRQNSSDSLMAIWSKRLIVMCTVLKKRNYCPTRSRSRKKIRSLERTQTAWVEPMKKWLEYCGSIQKSQQVTIFLTKKTTAKEIFGSNLALERKKFQRMD